jgi:hypothetical protein
MLAQRLRALLPAAAAAAAVLLLRAPAFVSAVQCFSGVAGNQGTFVGLAEGQYCITTTDPDQLATTIPPEAEVGPGGAPVDVIAAATALTPANITSLGYSADATCDDIVADAASQGVDITCCDTDFCNTEFAPDVLDPAAECADGTQTTLSYAGMPHLHV